MWKILIVCIISSHYSLTSNAPIELLLLTLFWILRYFIPSATYSLNNTNTNNCVLSLLFLILTMSTKTFLVYVLSCFSFALLSALFLMHNNQNPFPSSSSLSSTSTRYGSGTDRIWPVQNFLTFFSSSSNIALFNLDYLCLLCRNWNRVGNLFWPQLLVFLDQHVEPLVVLVVVAFSFLCLIFFLVSMPNLLLLFLNVIATMFS